MSKTEEKPLCHYSQGKKNVYVKSVLTVLKYFYENKHQKPIYHFLSLKYNEKQKKLNNFKIEAPIYT